MPYKFRNTRTTHDEPQGSPNDDNPVADPKILILSLSNDFVLTNDGKNTYHLIERRVNGEFGMEETPTPYAYNLLVEYLDEMSDLRIETTAFGALQQIAENAFKAIFVTGEVIAQFNPQAPNPEIRDILAQINLYLEEGGLVFAGFRFQEYLTHEQFDKFFGDLGLTWRRGDCHRTIFYFTPSGILLDKPLGDIDWTEIPGPYCMKAISIENATAEEKLFVPVPGAMTQSLMFTPKPVDERQAAHAVGKVGKGRLVYIGDVGGSAITISVIMAILGAQLV